MHTSLAAYPANGVKWILGLTSKSCYLTCGTYSPYSSCSPSTTVGSIYGWYAFNCQSFLPSYSKILTCRPTSTVKMQTVVSMTYDIYSNQLINAGMCAASSDTAANPQDPVYDGTSTCTYYRASNSTSTCTAAPTTGYRRFCPCSVRKSRSSIDDSRMLSLHSPRPSQQPSRLLA
jgi:hypothetical protein